MELRLWKQKITNPHCRAIEYRAAVFVKYWNHKLIVWEAGYQPQGLWADSGWNDGPLYLTVQIRRKWSWGEEHYWYDGPHCARKFGWLAFTWSHKRCNECMPGDEDD